MSHNDHTDTLEQLINDTDELLRCTHATAYESADNLRGSQRDHAFSVVHLLEAMRGKVDRMLRIQEGQRTV
jgi:hypothetical protein